jgi:autotransporter-associated beta strand protein
LTLASDVVISSSLSSGDLVKAGSGALTLSGDNSNWFGNVTLQAGGTLVGSSTALGTGTVTFDGGTLSSNGTTARTVSNAVNISANTTLGNATNNGTLTLSGAVNLGGGIRTLTTASNVVISGTISNGDLVKNGSFSALTLSGDNSNWSGSISLEGGSTLVGSSTALGTGDVFLRGSSFSSDSTTARTFSNNISISSHTTLGHVTNSGLLTLSGSISTRYSDTLTTASDVIFSGAITGTGFSKNGSGTLTLSGDSTANSGNFDVTGGTLVVSGILGASTLTVSAGTLVLNGTIVAKNSNIYGPNVVGVLGGATITGSGTIQGGLYVAGSHNPGNSPGIQTVTGDVSYGPNAAVYWELGANTVSNSPAVLFDQIVVGGNLDFLGATILNLSFNPVTTGGTVDWSDSFWLADRSWQIFDVAGTTTGLGNVTLSTQDWLDAQGDSFDAVLGGSFSLSQSGSDIYLTYSAIPEPSTYGLILGGLALVGAAVRRRRAKRA